jgi:3-oxoacyl-[acyl-carrier protein] reductase
MTFYRDKLEEWDTLRLKGKTAVITGSANGIGRETAITFAKEGANVVVADFDETAGLETVNTIKESGGSAFFHTVDVTNLESVTALMTAAKDVYGSLDILINNAGITSDGMLTKLSDSDWQKVINVNLTGVFYCTQAAVPYMIEQGKGKIISASSISGVYGNVGQTNYAATKAGVIGMTKTWAKELGRKGITVNAVAPGFIETGMVAKVPEKVIEKMKTTIPLGRLGQPTDIAKAYLYLASDDADYVNGAVLHIDGGIVV